MLDKWLPLERVMQQREICMHSLKVEGYDVKVRNNEFHPKASANITVTVKMSSGDKSQL